LFLKQSEDATLAFYSTGTPDETSNDFLSIANFTDSMKVNTIFLPKILQ